MILDFAHKLNKIKPVSIKTLPHTIKRVRNTTKILQLLQLQHGSILPMDMHLRSRLLDLQEDQTMADRTAWTVGPTNHGLPAFHQPAVPSPDIHLSGEDLRSYLQCQHG